MRVLCRNEELTKLSTADAIDEGGFMTVSIKDTKTYVDRQLVITEGGVGMKFENTCRFGSLILLTIVSSLDIVGKLHHSARSNKLAEHQKYTGHCFRRSSTSLLANAGAELSVIKRHEGWRSGCVAEGYIKASVANKCKIAHQILGEIESMTMLKTRPLVRLR